MRALIACLILSVALVGCQSAEKPAAAPAAEPGPTPTAFKNASGQLVCPMMNVVIKSEADAAGYVDHDGTRYYLCCDACVSKGKANPASVAEKAKSL